MSVFAFNRFAALLSLLALAVAVAVVIPGVRRRLTEAGLAPLALWLAAAVALLATAGSLTYSEHFLFEPCRLCWYQRIAMYPLAITLGIGAFKRDPLVSRYSLIPAVLGAVIAGYHVLIQLVPELGSGACTTGIPCTAKWVNEFGFVSIPVMALFGFVAIIVLVAGFAPALGSRVEEVGS